MQQNLLPNLPRWALKNTTQIGSQICFLFDRQNKPPKNFMKDFACKCSIQNFAKK